MIDASRLTSRMEAQGISQAELARRVGLSQQAVGKLAKGTSRSSFALHRIAAELETTPAYLEGQVDDSSAGAPPPRPLPRHQPLMLPVMLPADAALEAAFLGVLLASEDMTPRELARELAKRLPTVLRLSASAIVAPTSAEDDDLHEPGEPPADAHRVRRRA